ncbi:nose resistant to fluoxetine protein 6 [Caerostris extrusa]|uniref:Nose resistant to fluoxetine protein 6 n=1 Tax=Caerostris extrusa TaxID=172846 RepID=A0AAV4XXM9_CAEEX|nr:nose resistant to fluoxetine protein 6 [Caerostris extrusa]
MERASTKCYEDVIYLFENLASFNWAIKMLDSYGKPESGILLGNLKWIGEYDECIKAYAPQKEDTNMGGFHGKYCTLQVPIELRNTSMPLSIAVCLPDTCNPSLHPFKIPGNLNISNLSFIEEMDSVLNNITLTCRRTSREYTTGAIVVICLLSFFAVLAFIGSSITALEYYMRISPSKESIYGKNVSENASINEDADNLSQKESDDVLLIAKTNQNELPEWLENKDNYLVYMEFAFLSISWVILGHTYGLIVYNTRNLAEGVDMVNHWSFQIILNGFYSVDSFFVLSGFLVAYLYFQQCSKIGGKIPWLYFYIHRYIRLTPVYMIVLAYFTTLYTYVSDGPYWPDYDVDANCQVRWWWNPLYINNFLDSQEQCMAWAWYLANDMQFYVISPLFLISLWRWPKVGLSLMGLFFAISFTANFAITYEYNFVSTLDSIFIKGSSIQAIMNSWTDFMNKIYSKPYTRISAYLVGILLAYFLYKRNQSNSPKLNKVTLSVGWIVASGVTLACVFGLYNHQQTLIEACFYNSLSRTCFACGLSWVIFVCVTGQGGVVNSILSWKVWIPVSRLTYCAYLVHLMVIQYVFFTMRRLFEFSHITMILYFIGILFMSYIAALITSLLFESPVIRLERLIRNKFKS